MCLIYLWAPSIQVGKLVKEAGSIGILIEKEAGSIGILIEKEAGSIGILIEVV